MRVLIGSLTYPLANGVTTSIDATIDGLLAYGHQVKVVGPEYGVGRVRPEHYPVSASPLSSWLLSAIHKKERLFAATAAREIRSLITTFQPDLYWLHTVSWLRNAFEQVIRRITAPRILTYHTLVEQYGRLYVGEIGASIMRSRSREVSNAVDAVITPSQVIAHTLLSYGVHRPIYVIPTGIKIPKILYRKEELAERWHFSQNATVLLYVGRVSKEKNLSVLLRLTKQLSQQGEYILLLVGPGDVIATNREAEQLGISDLVICTGPLPREDTQRIYGGADVFVFASQTETQGLVIGEAMLAGVPVVALDSPIRPEIYPESVARVVYHEADFPAAVSKLITNHSTRRKQISAAQNFVKTNFSVERMIDKQLAVLEKVVQNYSRIPSVAG